MKPRVDKKGKALHNTPLLSRGWFNPFLLVFFCFSDLRDGPLEKLWVGGGGGRVMFKPREFFFVIKFLV